MVSHPHPYKSRVHAPIHWSKQILDELLPFRPEAFVRNLLCIQEQSLLVFRRTFQHFRSVHLGLEMAQRQCCVPPFGSLPVFGRPCNGANGAFDGGDNLLVRPLATLPNI